MSRLGRARPQRQILTRQAVLVGGVVGAIGTITIIGDVVADGIHRTFGTSTFIGDVISTATAIKFALGTITITGDVVSVGTNTSAATITMLGEGISEGTHAAFGVTSFIGELIAGGGTQFIQGTSTATGNLVATAISLVPAAGTITFSADAVADGVHILTETTTFIGEVNAIGTNLGGVQSASGTITMIGNSVSEGTHVATATSTFIGDVAAVGFSQNDALGTSTIVGELTGVGTQNARATITMLGEGISEGVHNAFATITFSGEIAATQHSLAFATSTFIGDLAAIGNNLSDISAAGTITYSGDVAASGTHLAGGTITASGQVAAAGVDLFRFSTATITIFGLSASEGSKVAFGTSTFSGALSAIGQSLLPVPAEIILFKGRVDAFPTVVCFIEASGTVTMTGNIGTADMFVGGDGTLGVKPQTASIGIFASLKAPPPYLLRTWTFSGGTASHTHDVLPNSLFLNDNSFGGFAFFPTNSQVGNFARNQTDNTDQFSLTSGRITSNTPTQVTHDALTGGIDNDWDVGDIYELWSERTHACGTIIIKGELSAIISKASCVNPKGSINLTSSMTAAQPILVLGPRFGRGTVNVTGDMPTTSASLPHAGLTNITSFMSARGRIIPEGNMPLLAERSDVNLAGFIGPATIDGQKQARISTSFGSIELYNNSAGAFYSIGGAGTIKEAFALVTFAGTAIAKGRKDQTQFGKATILWNALITDDGADPKGIHINNLATVNFSGAVTAHGSVLGKGAIIPTGQLDVGGGSHIQRATTSFIGLITQAKPTHFKFILGTSTFAGALTAGKFITHFRQATITATGAVSAAGQNIIVNAFGTITLTGTCVADGRKRPLSVNVTPSSISDVDTVCPLTSDPITATAVGGRQSYTYAWAFTAGGGGMTINSPTSSVTTVTVSSEGFRSGTLRCIVTDADFDTASDSMSINLECGLA